MRKQTYKERLITRGIRISPSLNHTYKRAGVNLSGLARRLLEEYAERGGLE